MSSAPPSPGSAPAPEVPPAGSSRPVGWRQSLGAGLMLGLALGCGWLARWTPRWYPRALLALLAAGMALLGLALLLAASENWPWAVRVQRFWHERLGPASFPFFTALVLLALAALATGNNLLYLLVSGLIAALIISGATAALNLSGLELSFDLPPSLFAGREVLVPFQLVNAKSWWPAYSVTVQASSRGSHVDAAMSPVYFPHLGRGGRARGEGHMTFPRRGRYAGAAFVCATRFPFGLLQKRRRFQAGAAGGDDGLIVYPAPAAGLRPPNGLRELAAQAAGAARRGDGEDIYRIRRHVAGESVRRVDWKASARTSALHVREYQDEQAPRVRLRLARAAGVDSEGVERALSLCAGWVLALEHERVLLEFVGEYAAAAGGRGLHLAPAPAAEQRRPLLEYLAMVDAAADPEPLELRLERADHEIVVG